MKTERCCLVAALTVVPYFLLQKVDFITSLLLGAFALIQLQEDMKRQLSAEGNYTEEELEEYMQSHKKIMIDSLWKLNVADIETTLSRVCQMVVHEFLCSGCMLLLFLFIVFILESLGTFQVLQDNNVRKEELRARAKGLKTLGKVFQVYSQISY